MATKTDIATIGSLDANLKELKISLAQAPATIQYIEHVRAMDFQASELKAIHEAVAKFGSAQQILEAVNSYGSKMAIDKATAASKAQKERMDASLADAVNNFKGIQEKVQAASQSLHVLHRLEKEGLTESKMLHIEKVCEKLGGLEQAERKVSGYVTLEQLENEINLRKDELRQIEENMAHRQRVNEFAEKLLTKFRYNLSAIDEVYAAAEASGEPIETIRRINRLGDLQKIEAEIEKKDRELVANEIYFEAATEATQILSDGTEALKKQQKELIESIVGELSEAFKNATNSIAVEHQKGINRLSEFQEKYAGIMANAEVLENELKMARVLMTTRNFPAEVLQWPLEFAVLFLEVAARFCRAKSANPKIELKKQFEEKYGLTYIASANIAFLDLVEWAIEALELYIGRSKRVLP